MVLIADQGSFRVIHHPSEASNSFFLHPGGGIRVNLPGVWLWFLPSCVTRQIPQSLRMLALQVHIFQQAQDCPLKASSIGVVKTLNKIDLLRWNNPKVEIFE